MLERATIYLQWLKVNPVRHEGIGSYWQVVAFQVEDAEFTQLLNRGSLKEMPNPFCLNCIHTTLNELKDGLEQLQGSIEWMAPENRELLDWLGDPNGHCRWNWCDVTAGDMMAIIQSGWVKHQKAIATAVWETLMSQTGAS